LFESGAIVLHIAERFPGLLPKEPDARARVIMWMFAALSTVEPPIVDREVVKYFEDGKGWQSEHLAMVDGGHLRAAEPARCEHGRQRMVGRRL
jgi:glutathione S-transferase